MSDQVIRLTRGAWTFDPEAPIGRRGGFGAVFLGKGADGRDAAVKRLHISTEDAGHREMDMAAALSQRDLRHVMPVFDWGSDAAGTGYYLVMPRAETSLQSRLNAGALPESDALTVLLDIARGLAEVPDIVHRDLKPDNVLLFEGRWVIADFGIAKFVEDSTSLRTLRDCLTPPYGAPEQWRMEPPTRATDVYALGCVAAALLTGQPPFAGRPDQRHAHLREAPPPISVASARLRQLIAACLRKPVGARPDLASVIDQLDRARAAPRRPDPIAEAGAVVAERVGAEDAHAAHQRSKGQLRADLAAAAREAITEIRTRLFDSILDASSVARRSGSDAVVLGDGSLVIESLFKTVPEGTFQHSGWDVVSGWVVRVRQKNNRRYAERSANLWFADPTGSGAYRWYEVGHWTLKAGPVTRDEPFALERADEFRDADFALSNIMHSVNVTPRPPRAIDGTGEEWFAERWKRWLAQAATSSMSYPSQMPEP